MGGGGRRRGCEPVYYRLMSTTRRLFLLAAAGTLGLLRPAAALRLEDDPVLEERYFAACETRSAHDEVVREIVAQLEGKVEVTPETRAALVERVKAMNCPLCGCALGAIDPHPTRF